MIPSRSLVIAKPLGWVWSETEKKYPFEIRLTQNLEPAEVDYDVTIDTSWGALVVKASQIDSSLVTGGVL